MNKLWLRLSVAFAAVTILGLIIVAVLANKQVDLQFRQYVVQNQITSSDLLPSLIEYYTRNQSWHHVETVFDSATTGRGRTHSGMMGMGMGSGMMMGMSNVILTDASGAVIYDRLGTSAENLTAQILKSATPITNNGQVVGYLLATSSGQMALNTAATNFLSRINQTLVQAGLIAGSVGIVLGVLIAGWLTAPLARLAGAARKISQGQLNQRVSEKGAEEIADLAIAFNEMTLALQKAETLRRNMVADVAHELRTPLTVLQGNLRAILDDVYALDKAEIARLYDQTRLLNRLVDDLRELANAEAGKIELNCQSVDLPMLIDNMVATFQPVAEAENIALTARIVTNLPTIQADSTRLGQVLHNLLANALRHTSADGSITVETKLTEKDVLIIVRDTGEGISAEDLPHVFDRFYRADRARSRRTGGSGLGLAIVRAIVLAHGGQVSVTSPGIAGQGSEFTVTLPLFGGTKTTQKAN